MAKSAPKAGAAKRPAPVAKPAPAAAQTAAQAPEKKAAGNGAGTPAAVRAKATKDEILTYYRQMLLIRRFEERAGQLYGMGLIGGFCHLYVGQEAVVVGMP